MEGEKDQKFWTPKFFGPKFDLIFFQTKIFSDPKLFRAQNFLDTKVFGPKIVVDII